ncbi:MAG: DUF433 domain-containing protein [Caldilineaceae bacterium]
MARYALNLPTQLKQDAEMAAVTQGVSLNQFILWAVAEKIGGLKEHLDDPAHPHITYRRGSSGQLFPVVRGTGIRVQTLVVAVQEWDMSQQQLAREYDLNKIQVEDALAFYADHRAEIDAALQIEQETPAA